jgi:hypothetical protein
LPTSSLVTFGFSPDKHPRVAGANSSPERLRSTCTDLRILELSCSLLSCIRPSRVAKLASAVGACGDVLNSSKTWRENCLAIMAAHVLAIQPAGARPSGSNGKGREGPDAGRLWRVGSSWPPPPNTRSAAAAYQRLSRLRSLELISGRYDIQLNPAGPPALLSLEAPTLHPEVGQTWSASTGRTLIWRPLSSRSTASTTRQPAG